MIIVCDSCGTRFHLAEGRVGPKGAKVRCSNCHHSFQVTPAPKSADGGEHSPRAAAAGRSKAEARSRKVTGDPDLDNPEFLFDPASEAETPTGGTTVPDGVPFSSERSSPAGDVTQLHDPASEEDDATPGAKRAPTPLMGLDPEVSARQLELNRDLGASAGPARRPEPATAAESPFDFGRNEDYESTPMPGREPSLVVAAEPPGVAPTPAGTPEPDSEIDAFENLTGDEFDEGISRWDAPISAPSVGKSEPKGVRRVEVLRENRTAQRSGFPEARVPEPRATERVAEQQEVSAPPALPGEPFASPLWLRVAATAVGIGLVASALQASLHQTALPGPGPLEVQALGWSAEQVRAQPALDAAGDPTLEVEGSLRGPGGVAPPSVRVVLVDETGRALGGAEARVDRSRFVAALPEPPATARAFRIELGPPVEPPAAPIESTTAALPEPPPAAPEPQAETVPDAAPAAPGP